jgi:hypothetical protein
MCEGGYISVRLTEVLNPKPADNRTPEDVIGGIKEKIEKMK